MEFKPKSLEEQVRRIIDTSRELGYYVLSVELSWHEVDAAIKDRNLGEWFDGLFTVPNEPTHFDLSHNEPPMIDDVRVLLMPAERSLASLVTMQKPMSGAEVWGVSLYPISMEAAANFAPKILNNVSYSASSPTQEERIAALETKVRRLEEAVIGLLNK